MINCIWIIFRSFAMLVIRDCDNMEDIFGNLPVGLVTICTVQIIAYTVKPTRLIIPLKHTQMESKSLVQN